MVKVYWTEAEIIQLEDLRAEGKKIREIALIMGAADPASRAARP